MPAPVRPDVTVTLHCHSVSHAPFDPLKDPSFRAAEESVPRKLPVVASRDKTLGTGKEAFPSGWSDTTAWGGSGGGGGKIQRKCQKYGADRKEGGFGEATTNPQGMMFGSLL